jgi:hypothetical protein
VRQSFIREINGKILGSLDRIVLNDVESNYKDFKIRDVVFPQYTEKMCSDVHTYHVSELVK